MIAIDDYFAWIHARIVIIRDLCSYFFLLICSLLMWESSETIYCKNKWAVPYTKPWPPWPDKSVVIREAVAPGPLLSTCPSFTGTKHHQRHHHHHHHLRQHHHHVYSFILWLLTPKFLNMLLLIHLDLPMDSIALHITGSIVTSPSFGEINPD